MGITLLPRKMEIIPQICGISIQSPNKHKVGWPGYLLTSVNTIHLIYNTLNLHIRTGRILRAGTTYFLVLSFTCKHNTLVSLHIVIPKLIQLMLEITFCTNSKNEAVSKVLGHLEDAIPPVVGCLGIPHIVHGVVCKNTGGFTVIGNVSLPVIQQTRIVLVDPRFDIFLLDRTLIFN